MSTTAKVIDFEQRKPTVEQSRNAEKALQAVARARAERGEVVFGGPDGLELRLDVATADLISELLGYIARGEVVTIAPLGALVTTQQAADFLNVSRPHLVSLLTTGALPFVPVGSHRRVRIDDLMAYYRKREAGRRSALDQLAQLGQEFDAP